MKKINKEQIQNAVFQAQSPCFVLAHEVYDALPIHQFKYIGDNQWCEMVIQLTEDGNDIEYAESAPMTENVIKVLQPEKFFNEEARKDIKPGDMIEVCPGAANYTKEICSLLEVSRGAGLVVDYGEDHSFSNSFRGFMEHKLIKDWDTILKNVGQMDLTSYVNF